MHPYGCRLEVDHREINVIFLRLLKEKIFIILLIIYIVQMTHVCFFFPSDNSNFLVVTVLEDWDVSFSSPRQVTHATTWSLALHLNQETSWEHPLLIPFQLTTLHRAHRRFTGYLLCHLVIAESFWKLSNGLLHLYILFRLSLRCRTQFCHVLTLARESLTSGSWERQQSAWEHIHTSHLSSSSD